MNYIEWIKTLGLAVNLLVKTEFGSNMTVQFEWKQPLPSDLFISDSVPALYVSFFSKHDSGKMAGLFLVPWDNLYTPYNQGNGMVIPPYKLFTVTEYSVIYEDIAGITLDEAKGEILDKLLIRLKTLFDYDENQKILSEEDGLTTPGGVQLISVKEYKHYIIQKVALPGSKPILKFENDYLPENKMILRYLVPDYGAIKTQWMVPSVRKRNNCFEFADTYVLKTVNEVIEKLLNSDLSGVKEVCNKTWDSIKNFLIEQKCDNEAVIKYYNNFLQKVLNCDDKIVEEISYESIFGDYHPKLTPDELYDYMPAIYSEVQKLPGAELNNLPELITSFKKYRKLASKNTGKWVDGNMILGANPKEYKPTYEELMLCEIGNRIQIIKENYLQTEIREIVIQKMHWSGKIKFSKFSVIHMDVMGSGRFFYISSIGKVKFRLY